MTRRMTVVVYPHVMEIGGSQLNAVELAGAVRDLGHDVVVFGHEGPLLERVRELDLEFVPAPPPGRRPSPPVMGALTRLGRERSVDLFHGYEWTTVLEQYTGPRLRSGTPVVGTVMSMAVAPFIPYDVPLVVGTEQIAHHERSLGRPAVTVIEPPVDTEHNRPGAGGDLPVILAPGALTVVCVTRLAQELKLEGVLAAVEAVGRLAVTGAVQLLIVGDGPARSQVQARADAVNGRLGRTVVQLTGELADPRPAYAAADICLGMGGSALRALAFARPLVVQGERGFWEVFGPETLDTFLWTGMYGVGADERQGPNRLTALLTGLLADRRRREELGRFGRRVVDERFSLRTAAVRQLEIYERASVGAPGRFGAVQPATVAAGRFARYKAERKLGGLLRRQRTDDFNARPVAAQVSGASARPSASTAAGDGRDAAGR